MATVLASHGQPAPARQAGDGKESLDWHCIVATRSENFLFNICFELGAVPNARVTGCLSLFQAWQTAGVDLPRLAVVDSRLVDEDPDGVLTLASCMEPDAALVVLTDRTVQDLWSRWGTTRLVYRQRPTTPGQLSAFLGRLLRGETGRPASPPEASVAQPPARVITA